MKRIITYLSFALLILISIQGESQINLVPNWSFENYISCDSMPGGIQAGNFPPWDSPNGGNPDGMNFNCPYPYSYRNVYGYQVARTGVGYIASGVFMVNNQREYPQVELDSQLVAQRHYCASFYVSYNNKFKIACNNIGMYFSNNHISITAPNCLNFIPQINDTNIISDTLNWTLISGEYIAQGGESYIILGNFYPYSLTDTIHFNNTGSIGAAVYYIDDVSVYAIKKVDAGEDSIIICKGAKVKLGGINTEGVSYRWQPTVGLNDSTIGNPIASPDSTTTYYVIQTTPCAITTDSIRVVVKYCPPPVAPVLFSVPTLLAVGNVFKINGLQAKTKLNLYNALGQIVYKTDDYDNLLNTSSFSSGIYFYNIQADTGETQRGKIIMIE